MDHIDWLVGSPLQERRPLDPLLALKEKLITLLNSHRSVKRSSVSNEPATGVGEEVMGATTAAIANAFFDATGARLRQYPMTPQRVLAART